MPPVLKSIFKFRTLTPNVALGQFYGPAISARADFLLPKELIPIFLVVAQSLVHLAPRRDASNFDPTMKKNCSKS